MDRLSDTTTAKHGDWSAILEVGLESAWSAEVRVTQFPNVMGAPDRSSVFYQAGGATGDDAFGVALRAAIAEVQRSDDTEPRPARWDDEVGR